MLTIPIFIIVGNAMGGVFTLPLGASANVYDFYKALDSLPSGSKIWAGALGYGSATYYQAIYALPNLIKYMYDKGFKIVVWGGEVPLCDEILRRTFGVPPYGDSPYTSVDKVPGYGGLNKIPGKGEFLLLAPLPAAGATQITADASDFTNTLKKDYYGYTITDLPLYKEFKGGSQADLIFAELDTYPIWYSVAAGKPLVFYSADVSRIALAAHGYYNAGMMKGFIISLKQCAQWEILVGRVGKATVFLFANALMGATIIIGLIVQAVQYVTQRGAKVREKVG